MKNHQLVSKEQWLEARLQHLAKEKEFTKLRDELSRQRRELPWITVEKEYVFDGLNGKESLADLFEGKNQLLIYHFMFGPDWKEGCKSCSFWADNYNGIVAHLKHRDVTLTTVSKAKLETLEAYKKRMGWSFKWVFSYRYDFNCDFQVSFTPEEVEKKQMYYNYRKGFFPSEEGPGISVFYKGDNGQVYHTYSCYSRGLDMLNGAYHLLDLVPKGRDEHDLPYGMAWLRHKDRY